MNKLKFLTMMAGVAVMAISCSKKEDDPVTPEPVNYGYHAHVSEPTVDDKMMGQTLHMEATFESHTGQPVYNVRVKLYKKTDKAVVLYTGPTPNAVNETDGSYEFHEHIDITAANGFEEHTDYVFEAAVWGPTAADGLIVEKVEFHVHPM